MGTHFLEREEKTVYLPPYVHYYSAVCFRCARMDDSKKYVNDKTGRYPIVAQPDFEEPQTTSDYEKGMILNPAYAGTHNPTNVSYEWDGDIYNCQSSTDPTVGTYQEVRTTKPPRVNQVKVIVYITLILACITIALS